MLLNFTLYLRRVLCVSAILVCIIRPVFSCTDFLLQSADHSYIVARSLEFGQILPTKIKVVPRGEKGKSEAPLNQQGISWTSKYGYIAMVVFDSEAVVDGFNEKGLSVGALWFPDAQYPDPASQKGRQSIAIADLGAWLLATCATTQEAQAALQNVFVYGAPLAELSGVPPLHLSLHDSLGHSAVIEFLYGQTVFLDNPIGVLTNAPEFIWHMTNLRNYINLSAINKGPISLDGSVLKPTGQGSGLLGIPGDWTPPSRFVRAAIFKQSLDLPKDAPRATLAAIHLLNTFDIPYGVIRGSQASEFEFTQWIVIKDLTHGKLSFRTYGDPNIHTIELRDYDLRQGMEPSRIDLHITSP